MADVEFRINADLDSATSEVRGFRKEYAEMVRAVEKPLRQVNAFRDLEADIAAIGPTLSKARDRVRELGDEMARAHKPSKQLQADYKDAVAELQRLSRSEQLAMDSLSRRRRELQAAGVDTRNLLGEQKRLQAELSRALDAGRTDAVQQRHQAAAQGIRAQTIALREQAQAQRQANIEGARQDLGVTRYRALQAQLGALRTQYDLLRRTGNLTNQELAVAQRTLSQRIRETTAELRRQEGARQAATGGGAAGRLVNVAGLVGAGYGAMSAMRAYSEITDTTKKLDAQLRLVTESQEDFSKAQSATFAIAQRSQAPLEDVVQTYARLAPALDQVGRKRDTAAVVDALTKALRINGSSSAEAASTLQQFSQAMASGVLRGEEFNSLAESAPPLLRAFAEGLGVPVGQLRAMAVAGELTTEVITDLTVKALPGLTEQAEKLPDTVDGALTRLRNDVLKAFSGSDSAGLLNAITELRRLLTDPAVVQGLSDLAAGMATFAGWTVQAANGVVDLAKGMGYLAALASGNVDELTRLEKQLGELKEANANFIEMGVNDYGLNLHIADLEKRVTALRAKQSGMTVEAYQASLKAAQEGLAAEQKAQQEGAAEQEKIDNEKYAAFSRYVGAMKSKQDEATGNAEKAIKAQVKAEQKAAKELEAAKKTQLDTQKKYTDALAKLNAAGAAGSPTYAQAQALRFKAQQALGAGDVKQAKASAEAALDVLMELQEAGENTYGFEGFIKSLSAIAWQADQINVDKAQKSADEATKKAKDLKSILDSVKDTTITVKMDDAALAKVRSQIELLASLAGKPVEIGQSVLNPDGKPGKPAGTPGPGSALGAGLEPGGEPVPLKVKPVIVQDGENSFSNLPPVPVEVTPRIRQTGPNSWADFPPAEIEIQVDQAAANQAQQAISSLSTQFRQQMLIPVVPVVEGAAGAPAANTPGFATGGILRGPGTGTSDSILARLSNGEGVLTARAVQHYGAGLVHQLNRLQLPKFAAGGVMGVRNFPSIPSPGPALRAQLESQSLGPMGSFDFSFPGGDSFTVYAPPKEADKMRRLAMKFGRTHKR